MMKKKKIIVLGSTGSIGKSALSVLSHDGAKKAGLSVAGLGCFSNVEVLFRQAVEIGVRRVSVLSPGEEAPVRELESSGVRVFSGKSAFFELIEDAEPDIILNAVAGTAGLLYTKYALEHGIDVALANKESLIMGGDFLVELARRESCRIIPVDSEHSAICQLFHGRSRLSIRKIYLTGSGGPFLNRPKSTFMEISPEEALKHPRWEMGKKITIDSATLMNKGLEVIEAHYLFGLREDQIGVVIHPESIIHGVIVMSDGTLYAQMATPDMKGPIAYALLGEKQRLSELMTPVDFFETSSLHFMPPDLERFPLLAIAREVLGNASATIVMNSANEVAVMKFLNREISFPDIERTVRRAIEKFGVSTIRSLDDVLALDVEVRGFLGEKA